jgi:hypothetical protein
MNDLGYCDLMMSMPDTSNGNVALSYIINAKTDNLPDGDQQRAWEALDEMYAPRNAPMEMALFWKYWQVKHMKGKDRNAWANLKTLSYGWPNVRMP